ncbi:hypothetical protein QQF45_09275 [Halopseudomonas aestusnigri]|nr:hypothetical protein [Halopseudomonas aestusnigri]MDL2199258.1 hypothetical protein [Halopseudomonas aestusnigri]
MNNRINVTKRMAHGCRDSDYFFLKIKKAKVCTKTVSIRFAQA